MTVLNTTLPPSLGYVCLTSPLSWRDMGTKKVHLEAFSAKKHSHDCCRFGLTKLFVTTVTTTDSRPQVIFFPCVFKTIKLTSD